MITIKEYPAQGVIDTHETNFILSFDVSVIEYGELLRSRAYYRGFDGVCEQFDITQAKPLAFRAMDESWFDRIIARMRGREKALYGDEIAFHVETIAVSRIDTFTRILETPIPRKAA